MLGRSTSCPGKECILTHFIHSLNDERSTLYYCNLFLCITKGILIIRAQDLSLSHLRADADFKAVKWDRCVICELCLTVHQTKSPGLSSVNKQAKNHTTL